MYVQSCESRVYLVLLANAIYQHKTGCHGYPSMCWCNSMVRWEVGLIVNEVFLGGFEGYQNRFLVIWQQSINSTWEWVHVQGFHGQVYARSKVSDVSWNGLVSSTCCCWVTVICKKNKASCQHCLIIITIFLKLHTVQQLKQYQTDYSFLIFLSVIYTATIKTKSIRSDKFQANEHHTYF